MREPAEATHDGLVPDWLFPDWPVDARVRAFVTTRSGGVSTGAYAALNAGGSGVPPDDPAAVAENRRRIAARLPHRPTWLDQVHGTDVIRVSAPRDDAPVADAAVTQALDVPLAVRVADCLPVFLADRAGSAVGVAHAGWRGLAAGVLERTLEALDRAVCRRRRMARARHRRRRIRGGRRRARGVHAVRRRCRDPFSRRRC